MRMALLESPLYIEKANSNPRPALAYKFTDSSEWTRTTNLPDRGVIPIRIQILDRV